MAPSRGPDTVPPEISSRYLPGEGETRESHCRHESMHVFEGKNGRNQYGCQIPFKQLALRNTSQEAVCRPVYIVVPPIGHFFN